MGTVRVRPIGPVYDVPTTYGWPETTGDNYVPAETVGSPPQWGDQADGSYARLDTHGHLNPDGSLSYLVPSRAAANFGTCPGASSILGNVVHVRVMPEQAVPQTTSETGATTENVYRIRVCLTSVVNGDIIAMNNSELEFAVDLSRPVDLDVVMDNFTGGSPMSYLAAGVLSVAVEMAPKSYSQWPNPDPLYSAGGQFWARVYEVWMDVNVSPRQSYPSGAGTLEATGMELLLFGGPTGDRRAFWGRALA